jgi:hypothetical protein
MKILKDILVCLLLAAGSAFFLSLVLLVRDADKTVKAVPAEIAATRSALTAEITATRQELLETVRHDLLVKADSRLASIERMVDARTQQALKLADFRLSGVVSTLGAIRADARPALVNAAALTANAADLTKDAKDSLDDSYWDLKATIESATVATTSIAQTSETVRNAAPQIAASVQGIAKSADGVAADVKREADSIVAPKKWWQKALGPAYTVARFVALFL